MDTMPCLRKQDANEGVRGYRPFELSAVLSKMQERISSKRSTTKNGAKR